ncbi:MAG: preprotein translocase subunit YajC [Ignavibacteria bacterium]|jgi:preprotein translocase subunit YajC|nr:preprotein translocase subunit YajC [Ignavibacteria bacterium]MBK7157346.1 preprotein translocase subunit YajC [Ignavibacteria bacterium]MBK7255034.1 preprotein translocase subunit YajC [Ignavibacteria bacterium]MBK7446769.1 preprotein translocase subunit YajC [Ignavibacteria bacterium]MBK8380958.1 preprotein translocase subunit YajC [Ignavibacteria bacterium]
MKEISVPILLQQAPGGMESILSSIVPFLLIIVIFYFLILRPQQKRQKERVTLLESLKKGDKVITAGGIYGTVEGIEDKTILVKVSDSVKLKMERSSVTTIIGVTDIEPEKKSLLG